MRRGRIFQFRARGIPCVATCAWDVRATSSESCDGDNIQPAPSFSRRARVPTDAEAALQVATSGGQCRATGIDCSRCSSSRVGAVGQAKQQFTLRPGVTRCALRSGWRSGVCRERVFEGSRDRRARAAPYNICVVSSGPASGAGRHSTGITPDDPTPGLDIFDSAPCAGAGTMPRFADGGISTTIIATQANRHKSEPYAEP